MDHSVLIKIGFILRLFFQKADVLANGTLDSLVREGLITDQMATSLMNDSSYAYDTSERLIEVAERMFLAEGTDLKESGSELFIDKESLAEFSR